MRAFVSGLPSLIRDSFTRSLLFLGELGGTEAN